MARRSYPLSRVYGLVEPGPVVLLTMSHKFKRIGLTPLPAETVKLASKAK